MKTSTTRERHNFDFPKVKALPAGDVDRYAGKRPQCYGSARGHESPRVSGPLVEVLVAA